MKTERPQILIVDDEPEIREVMGVLLAEQGYRIRTASDGYEALEKLKESRPDLIILDMNMPKMGGVVFYHHIANPYDGSPKIPVLVLTARGDLEAVFDGFQVDGFMTKPFQFEQLIEEMERILNKRPAAQKSESRSVVPLKQASGKNSKVLLIDNDPEHFNAVIVTFMNAGIEVLSARNPRTACNIVKVDRPSAIFLGLKNGVPSVEEITAAQLIRPADDPSGIPIFFYPPPECSFGKLLANRISSLIPNSFPLNNADPDLLLKAYFVLINS